MAGYDTTNNSLSFTLYLLARHPDCQERASKECAALDLSSVHCLEDLQKALPFTYACLNEALRMYPPGFVTMRYAEAAVQVGPYRIPRGC